ncbi:hypothetical protein JG688_00016684 [Phytophthora aleatoria]|uniref:Uncharacterized protein n=1 Tax=Phytophthora aleatoria TaxID=2496075 RepID=A0A8J5ITR1_9STRA|nr:hypothetical protein JG688_00016684 [Phytophthora aleatoria]
MCALSAAPQRDEDRYYLAISQHETAHNYRVNKDEFEQITRNRMRLDKEQLDGEHASENWSYPEKNT